MIYRVRTTPRYHLHKCPTSIVSPSKFVFQSRKSMTINKDYFHTSQIDQLYMRTHKQPTSHSTRAHQIRAKLPRGWRLRVRGRVVATDSASVPLCSRLSLACKKVGEVGVSVDLKLGADGADWITSSFVILAISVMINEDILMDLELTHACLYWHLC